MLVVELDDGAATECCAELARRAPGVVVGIGSPSATAPDLDVLLTAVPDPPRPWVAAASPAAAAAELAERVRASPDAAVLLVQLLRMGTRLPLEDAVAAESIAYGLLQGGATFQGWLRARRPPRSRSAAEPVRLERSGDSLTITLDRPDVHNAYDAATRDALVEALHLLRADPSLAAAHLRGAGPSFCSGGDLSEFGLAPDPLTGHRVRMTRNAGLALASVADRVTAHLHGACIGAGIEIAAFASRVVAAPDVAICLPEVVMGLVPGAGGTVSIPRRIGRRRAAWLALSAATLDAATALDWGLVDEIAAAA